MDDKKVNKNDNNITSWVQMSRSEMSDKCYPFINAADWLIKTFCPMPWKNQYSSADYQAAQHSICLILQNPWHTKEWTLRFLATPLKCDPITLMNSTYPELDQLVLWQDESIT